MLEIETQRYALRCARHMRCMVECVWSCNYFVGHDLLSSSAYPMITYTHPVGGSMCMWFWKEEVDKVVMG